jgi:hypothetical protein
LWKISDSRAVFDKRLAAGEGPQEIRESEGLYFVHSKPCPAYDQAGGSCQIYGQALKPVGCSDFPVYEDRGSIMADLRCEAVDLKALTPAHSGRMFASFSQQTGNFPFSLRCRCDPQDASGSRVIGVVGITDRALYLPRRAHFRLGGDRKAGISGFVQFSG